MIILSICLLSLSVGFLVVGINYYDNNKQSMINDYQTQARLLAENAKGAVIRKNTASIMDVLNSIVMDGNSSAAIFDAIGQKLAMRDNNGKNYISEVEFKATTDYYWGPRYLHIWQIIGETNRMRGVVYLKISTEVFDQKLRTFALSSLLVLLALFVIIYIVATRMQKSISERLVGLDNISRKVSQSGNYSIRVPRYGDDEMVRLLDHLT
ncbi:MAG: hypothetical protein Q9M92_10255 [Enterobacterales bacterium]|nr:hypothetical protein [Enterobacterales bacterium]